MKYVINNISRPLADSIIFTDEKSLDNYQTKLWEEDFEILILDYVENETMYFLQKGL